MTGKGGRRFQLLDVGRSAPIRTMSKGMTFLLYALMIYLVVRMMIMQKSNKRMDKVINVVRLLDKENDFFQAVDTEIEASTTLEQKTKFQILKLWGTAYHNRYEEKDFDGQLAAIDLENLKQEKKMSEDDSFFYYFLAIPNILQKDGQEDRIKAMYDHLGGDLAWYQTRLDYQLSLACLKFYNKEDDLGRAFFEKVMDGDYQDMVYSKQLIGLYKQLTSAMLVKLYEDNGEQDKMDEMMSVAKEFNQTRIGEAWLKNIGVHMADEKKDEAESGTDREEDTAAETENKDAGSHEDPQESSESVNAETNTETDAKEQTESASREAEDLMAANSDSGTSFTEEKK